MLGTKAVLEAAAQAAHPAVGAAPSWTRGGYELEGCFKGYGAAPVFCLAVSIAHTLCWVPRPVNAPLCVFQIWVRIEACALLGCFWGAVLLVLNWWPDVCWGLGSCLMGSCCVRGVGEGFGFLWVVYTPGSALLLAG